MLVNALRVTNRMNLTIIKINLSGMILNFTAISIMTQGHHQCSIWIKTLDQIIFLNETTVKRDKKNLSINLKKNKSLLNKYKLSMTIEGQHFRKNQRLILDFLHSEIKKKFDNRKAA